MDTSLFDTLFEPVLIVDLYSKPIYFNNALVTFLKKSPRIIKKSESLKEMFYDVDYDFEKAITDVQKKSQILSEEVEINLEDEKLFLVFKLVYFEDKKLILICLNDISVEKRLHNKYREQIQELKNVHDQIIQADKLNSIGELTAGIAHEINNPLTIASGNAEMIAFSLTEKDLNTERESIMSSSMDIMNSLGRIKNIINSMKEFLYKSDEKEYVDLEEIIDRSLGFMKKAYKSDEMTLEKIVKKSDIVCLINQNKIEQVLINLLQNAIDATEDVDFPIVTVELGKEPDSPFVYIDVIDNGRGIDSANADKIFETFFTTKEIGKGTGLGLTISSKIINSHDGELTLKQNDGKTIFRIELPTIEVSSFTDNENLFQGNVADENRILVVDNEANILNLCKSFFADTGFDFIGSTCGEDALEILDKINVNLIITDIKMPSMSGTDFVKELRSRDNQTPVVYMSGKDKIESFQEDKDKLGVKGLLLKPFSRDELIKIIKSTVNN